MAVAGPRPRWWPALVIAGLASVALAWLWLPGADRSGQDRVMGTVPILLVTVVLLAVWLVLFSRFARRLRLLALAGGILVVAIAASTLRVRGVTGDLVPVFEWRWAARTPPALEALPPPAPAPVAPPAPASDTPSSPAAVPAATPTPAPETAPSPSLPVSVEAIPSGEFPQFLGPERNGVLPNVHLATDWTTHPPRAVWRRPVGQGWSGFAVSRGVAVTQEQRAGQEMVVAYALATGAPRWSHADDVRFSSTIAGDGPRATPTIAGGQVFTLGSTGILNALDLETGRRRWRRDIVADHNAAAPDWGRSGSPLVVDGLVVVAVGGDGGPSLVAYRAASGEPVWRAGHDRTSYSSPLLATLAGVRQIVMLNEASVSGHEPATGRLLWEHPWPGPQPTVAQPLPLGTDRLLLSGGYGIGSKLLQLAADPDGTLHSTLVWESPRLKAKFTNLVVRDGFIYGLDDGVLVCLDPATGERRWRSGRYGHGQVLLVGGVLLVQTEDGDLLLVDPRPDEPKELARMTVFAGKTWNPPALAGRLLLLRTDAEAVAYELSVDSR